MIQLIHTKDAHLLNELSNAINAEKTFFAHTEPYNHHQSRVFLDNVYIMGGACLGYFEEEKLLGFMTLNSYPYSTMKHVCSITLGLHQSARGKGIGSQLFTHAIQFGKKDLGFTRFEIEVFAKNINARRFYEKHQCHIEGRKINARILDGEYDDIILYAYMD